MDEALIGLVLRATGTERGGEAVVRALQRLAAAGEPGATSVLHALVRRAAVCACLAAKLSRGWREADVDQHLLENPARERGPHSMAHTGTTGLLVLIG
jgi:hypothetical protein